MIGWAPVRVCWRWAPDRPAVKGLLLITLVATLVRFLLRHLLAFVVICAVLLAGHWPHWGALALQLAGCLLVAVAGAIFFRAARKGFSDVV